MGEWGLTVGSGMQIKKTKVSVTILLAVHLQVTTYRMQCTNIKEK